MRDHTHSCTRTLTLTKPHAGQHGQHAHAHKPKAAAHDESARHYSTVVAAGEQSPIWRQRLFAGLFGPLTSATEDKSDDAVTLPNPGTIAAVLGVSLITANVPRQMLSWVCVCGRGRETGGPGWVGRVVKTEGAREGGRCWLTILNPRLTIHVLPGTCLSLGANSPHPDHRTQTLRQART